jgi:RNA polymerase sigma-70 factor (ECF subfamily)
MRKPAPQKIVGGFNRREGQAITWVYDEYYPAVFGYVMKMVGEHSPDLEDLVAETFLKALKSKIRFDRLARIRSFLLTSARNLCIDYLRREVKIQEGTEEIAALSPLHEDPAPHDLLTNESLVSEIFLAITRLPKPYQEMLRLSYMNGFSNDEIARQLNISTKTVSNKKNLALEMLKKTLKKTGLLILLSFLS